MRKRDRRNPEEHPYWHKYAEAQGHAVADFVDYDDWLHHTRLMTDDNEYKESSREDRQATRQWWRDYKSGKITTPYANKSGGQHNPSALTDQTTQINIPAGYIEPAEGPSKLAEDVDLPKYIELMQRRLNSLQRREALAAELPDAWPRVVLKDLHRIAELTRSIIETTVTKSVNNGTISRKAAADIIGVHQATVARWANEGLPPNHRTLDDDYFG